MSNDQIIRAWKDESYRSSLSEHERAQLPPHPAGLVELTDSELNAISGGFGVNPYYPTALCNVTNHPVGCGGQTNKYIWC
jgi:mersacidin/lichenicidin family type 2 lantibiotic